MEKKEALEIVDRFYEILRMRRYFSLRDHEVFRRSLFEQMPLDFQSKSPPVKEAFREGRKSAFGDIDIPKEKTFVYNGSLCIRLADLEDIVAKLQKKI